MRTTMKIKENPPEPLRTARQFLTLHKFLQISVIALLYIGTLVGMGDSACAMLSIKLDEDLKVEKRVRIWRPPISCMYGTCSGGGPCQHGRVATEIEPFVVFGITLQLKNGEKTSICTLGQYNLNDSNGFCVSVGDEVLAEYKNPIREPERYENKIGLSVEYRLGDSSRIFCTIPNVDLYKVEETDFRTRPLRDLLRPIWNSTVTFHKSGFTLVQTELKSLSVKESDSDRIAEELRTERLKREVAEQRASELEKQRNEEAKRYADERKQQEEQEKKIVKAQPVQTRLVEHPIQKGPSIPAIARGYEDIYQRFLRGVLIYRPTSGSDVGKIELPIASLLNPLESLFDLSRCGDAGKYLSISTGYRRAVNPENSSKWEVFIAPKFLVEAQKATTATHYTPIANETWTAPYAVIQNYGGWTSLNDFWYNTTITDQEINSQNLNEIFQSEKAEATYVRFRRDLPRGRLINSFIFNFN